MVRLLNTDDQGRYVGGDSTMKERYGQKSGSMFVKTNVEDYPTPLNRSLHLLKEGYTGRGCMLKCLGMEMRLRVEGGAPYRYGREHGKPQYPPDCWDSKQTYPEWALAEWMRSEEGIKQAERFCKEYARAVLDEL